MTNKTKKDALLSAERRQRQIEMLEEAVSAYQKSTTRQGMIIITLLGVTLIFLLGMIFSASVWEYEKQRGDALCIYVHSLEGMQKELLGILNNYDERYPDQESVPVLDCD